MAEASSSFYSPLSDTKASTIYKSWAGKDFENKHSFPQLYKCNKS